MSLKIFLELGSVVTVTVCTNRKCATNEAAA
jgi:hypothetical protein